MNGNLAVNIDEEALFEVLATANFAAPPEKATARMPASIIESKPEATSISPWSTGPENNKAALPTLPFPSWNASEQRSTLMCASLANPSTFIDREKSL